MKLARRLLLPIAGLLLGATAFAAPIDDVNEARRNGWDFAGITIRLLRQGKGPELPGIKAWMADYEVIEKQVAALKPGTPLPKIDADALLTHNPNFWAMYYDIAPGDPALALLHSGILLAGGEAQRASHIAVFALQRPGVEQIMKQALNSVAISAMSAQKTSLEFVQSGVRMHDAGDYPGALKRYDEAIGLLPTNGWAYYEKGFTLRAKLLRDAGKPAPANDSVAIGEPSTDPAEVLELFTQARLHDPFQYQAWQGTDESVLKGARALISRGQPVWEAIRKDATETVTIEQLADLSEACRIAHIDDYALVLRQIIIARRQGVLRADNVFITECLRRLASGPVIEAVVQKLYQDGFQARQLAPIEGPTVQRAPINLNQPPPSKP